jgi:hypothetical protein
MAELTEQQIRVLFRRMHAKGSSTNNIATAGRSNTAAAFDGDKFLEEFDAMLEENFDIAVDVYKKFGA